MFKNSFYVFCLVFLCFLLSPQHSFSQENATDDIVVSTTAEIQSSESLSSLAVDPATEIVRIKEIQLQVQETLQKQEAAASAASATPMVEALQKQVESINNLFLIHSQQISVYENRLTLEEERRQIQTEHDALKSVTDTESISFLELNNLREQVNAEIAREQSITSKIDLAGTALEQANSLVAQRQTQINDLNVKIDNTEDETQKEVLQQEIIAANYALRAANERVILRQIEKANENFGKEVYQARTALLKDRLERAQTKVVFTQEQLNEQLGRLDKLKYDLDKKSKQLLNEKSNIDLRLQAQKNRVAQTQDPPQSMLDQRKALDQQAKSVDNQIQLINDQIQQIPTRVLLWNQRFDVFNNKVEKTVMIQYKTEAGETLKTLDSSDREINLSLDLLQTDLITVQTSITNLTDEQQDRLKPLQNLEEHYQSAINAYRDQQNFIEVTRRLTTKLINEVDQVLAIQTWGDYFDTLLKKEFYSNTYRDWLYALILVIVIFTALIVVRWILLNRFKALEKKVKTPVIEGVLDVIQRTRPTFFLIWSVFIASTYLKFTDNTETWLVRLMLLALTIQGAIMVSYFMQTFIKHFFAKKARHNQANASAMAIINFISQLLVWSLALYLGLESVDIEATPLITGLGIGGLAVALALQNILSDLFASLSIVIDKPFVVGDFIIMDTYMGNVEQIGIKTTRIRSLSGEQIICANGDLLNTRIRNFKRMHERRIVFPLGVTYQTTHEQLQMIPQMIQEAVERNDLVRFDRSHFKDFGDFSLNFETVFYVLTSDYAIYMNIQQNINLELFKRFAEEGIEFAYPTQTVFVEKNGSNPEVN